MFDFNNFDSLVKKKGLTKQFLAQKINKHPSVFRDWERGRSTPSVESLRILAECLGCAPGYLNGETEKPTAPQEQPVSKLVSKIADKVTRLSPEDAEKALEYVEMLEMKRKRQGP